MSTKDTPPPSSIASRMIQPRFGELVQVCRQLVMNRLAELLGNVFSQVDDTLFEGAEKAENNQVQALFFDAMREIRKERPALERFYHQRIAQGLSDFLEGRLPADDPYEELDADHLTLVEHDEYEETLLIINMVNQVKAQCVQPLFALGQRLALLNNGSKIGEDRNPFGPQAIVRAYSETLAQAAFPLRVKTILYVLFEQQVMQHLAPLYEQLNQRLADAGILPNLKYRAPDDRPAPTARPATPEKDTAPPLQPHHYDVGDLPDLPPADRNALFGGLAVLLAEHRRRGDKATLFGNSHSIASFGPSSDAATTTYSARELLEALNRLQRESAQELAQRLRQPQPVEALKADLQRQLEAGAAYPANTRLTDQEADVIDLVGMVFDFILDDENLPDSCKTTLSHLHTPYLKVALQDKQLFTQHHHPARKLLNAMAQAGVIYGGEDEERSLLAKMHWVVEQVVQGFVGDFSLFDALLGEFNEYVANLRQKVELRERRAMEAARGRDRLLAAREQALEVIAGITGGRDLPPLVRNFLELSWCDALTFIALRAGEHSDEWKRACEVGEQLAWSVTPLDAAGREHLQALRLGLLDELRKGLELLGGYHEDGIRRLLQDLVACQHAIQTQQPQVAAQFRQDLPESPLGVMLGAEVHSLDLSAGEPLPERVRELIKELAQVEFGTWFEFRDVTPPRRLKLSWFSPTTRNYMFVDQTGQRVAVKPLVQLAREIESGTVRLIPAEHAVPLMDRALNAIYRVLQRITGRAPAQH
ncbi:hypothetical protein H681_04780 [Pseudomonas sp. ATCC 13867]|uniref:DUF1631 domain-containing protein n=1 Tax=Pseudomonas sp. ATCC 13867 TaxID=1294143 RepID=UPI0002C4EEE2|nr:DUF1631 domain-containing protein [Pseudomonas sp. ATCC 13867]AGI22836.1 hypothetical protein H681_04780 [Pseudomonas sp. ATCC 13867]RFQ25428.1 DUF1631 domain-containing protein [Pseudomonas sp. ATCC 13867]